MDSHTPRYAPDEPIGTMNNDQQRQTPAAQCFLSMPEFPFRVVTMNESRALYSGDHADEQPYMVDLLSGDAWQRCAPIRQPVAEDFLQPHHPLPPPPVAEYDSEQDLPVIEPASYLNEPSAIESDSDLGDVLVNEEPVMSNQASSTDLSRRRTIASTKPLNIVKKPDPVHNKRSKSALAMSSHASPSPVVTLRVDGYQDAPLRIRTIGSDMFSSALGGLHRLPDIAVRKESKRDRFKRFFSIRRRWDYGRAAR
jgi:hypothetical protein